MKDIKKQEGYLLIEVLVSLFIISILVVGVYGLIILYLQISNDNKMHVIAIELANQKMEQIRNMPYDNIGVISGIPSGTIPQEEAVEREGNFTVNNYVVFYDDPADGQAGSTTLDTIPTDYKIATVKVSWLSKFGIKNVTVFSKIIPRTVETDQGYGLLKITVRDSYAQPVPTASIRVVNNAVSPAVNVVNLTNAQGLLYLPATSSVENFEITVTKTDQEPATYWGHDQTYAPAIGKTPLHLSVSKGNMTEEEFQIDKLATLHLRTVFSNLPDNFQVNSTKVQRNESQPRMAADASDNLYFAWQGQNATSSYVYLGKYDSAGSRIWASDKTVNTSVSQSNPDIAATAAGEIFVVWQDRSVSLKAITLAPEEERYAMGKGVQDSNIKILINKIKSKSNRSIMRLASVFHNLIGRIGSIIAGLGDKADIVFNKVKNWPRKAAEQSSLALKVNEVKASATIVQAIKVSGVVVNNNQVTLSFTNPPTAGNMMIVAAIHENDNQSFTTVTNASGSFTASIVSDVAFGMDVGIWHKVVAAGEPSSVTVRASGNLEGGVMMLMEVSGIDSSNPVNVVKANNQTGSSSRTATTNSTAISTSNGFAVAAMTFADNDFNVPASASWSSGSSNIWTQRQWTAIDGNDDTSIGVATMDVTAAAVQSATLAVTGGGSNEERNNVMVVYNLIDPDDALVNSGGTQSASLPRSSAGQYIGAHFNISDLTGSHNVTSIKIAENGTIDGQSHLDNIKLLYDLDTSAPYDCAGETFSGSETQFGVTDTDGFSAADGTVQMNGSVAINTAKTMCVYAVMDIGAGAGKDETIELEITDPSTDITISGGTVIPPNPIVLSGTTKVSIPAELHQTIYRWRSDNGDEDDASWLEGENVAETFRFGEKARLRFRIENMGSLAGTAAYRLEYGKKVTTCSALGAWDVLPADNSGDWRSTSSVRYADGEATTQQLGSETFQTGEIKKDANQTSNLAIDSDTVTEIEFALAPTASAGDSAYCFRLTKAGTALDAYDAYAEASVIGDNNIYLIRLDSAGNQVWAAKRVNSDDSLADQTSPRIAITEKNGVATTVVAWMDNRAGQSDIYAQAFDGSGNALWNGGNDIAITSSTTDEIDASVAIDSNDDVIFAWTEEGVLDKIYLMKYDLQGNPLWPSPKPGPMTLFGISEPSLAVDGSGSFYLGYTEDVSGYLSAFMSKYDNAGVKTWDKDVNIETDVGDRYESSLAIWGSDLYAVWTDERNGNEDIYAQKFDLSGNPIWTRDFLASITVVVSSSTQPAIAVTSTGKPFTAWTDGRNAQTSIYAAELTAPGVITPVANVPLHLWGANTISEIPVIYEYDLNITTNGSGQSDIRVEADPGGYTVVASSTASVSVILLDPPKPLPLLPAQDQIWNIYVK
jgi:type II secretory pathway pseudopilin PulG